jgi:hypothetical protein
MSGASDLRTLPGFLGNRAHRSGKGIIFGAGGLAVGKWVKAVSLAQQPYRTKFPHALRIRRPSKARLEPCEEPKLVAKPGEFNNEALKRSINFRGSCCQVPDVSSNVQARRNVTPVTSGSRREK